jgi:hypothetical protein
LSLGSLSENLGYKAAHTEVWLVLGEQIFSLSQMRQWIRWFKDSHPSWEDED